MREWFDANRVWEWAESCDWERFLTYAVVAVLAATARPAAGLAWRTAKWPFSRRDEGGLMGALITAIRSPDTAWCPTQRQLHCPGAIFVHMAAYREEDGSKSADVTHLRVMAEDVLGRLIEPEILRVAKEARKAITRIQAAERLNRRAGVLARIRANTPAKKDEV